MPKPRAFVDYRVCDPKGCEGGECAAALACSLGLFKQPEPYAAPEPDQRMCMGCGVCVHACMTGAVKML